MLTWESSKPRGHRLAESGNLSLSLHRYSEPCPQSLQKHKGRLGLGTEAPRTHWAAAGWLVGSYVLASLGAVSTQHVSATRLPPAMHSIRDATFTLHARVLQSWHLEGSRPSPCPPSCPQWLPVPGLWWVLSDF